MAYKSRSARTSLSRRGKPVLVVEYDVTGLSRAAIGALELEALVQGEASDGRGGKRYDGKTGHPDVPVLGTRVMQRGKRSFLVVEFDVTGLSELEIGFLGAEAEVQGEASDEHPEVRVTSRVVPRAR